MNRASRDTLAGLTEFAGLNLCRADGSPRLGAAFVLRSPAPESRSVSLDGWTVDVLRGVKTVVARGPDGDAYGAAFAEGLEAANRGLDLFCAMSTERHLIENADEENLVWWPDPTTGGLRIVARAEVVTEARAGTVVLTAYDPDGNPRPPTRGPELSWHPSYRYFRVSQTTRDLHDAYRNGFLALESLLDFIAPQKRNEGEGKWFTRAMGVADSQISLAQELVPDSASPLKDLRDQFYAEGRSVVAHSKSSRTHVLPHDYAARAQMIDTLRRLQRFYLGLAAHVLGLRRGGSYFAPSVLGAMDAVVAQHTLYVTDDASPVDSADGRPSPAGRPLVPMSPVAASGSDRRSWSVSGDAVAGLDGIRRIVSALEGTVGLIAVLEADLVIGPTDTLEAVLTVRTLNASDPQLRFST
jgi:hypothetical protein